MKRDAVAVVPVWKPLKQPPRAVERRAGGTLLATRLFMAGKATPSPRPTIPLASMTAGKVSPAAVICNVKARDGAALVAAFKNCRKAYIELAANSLWALSLNLAGEHGAASSGSHDCCYAWHIHCVLWCPSCWVPKKGLGLTAVKHKNSGYCAVSSHWDGKSCLPQKGNNPFTLQCS